MEYAEKVTRNPARMARDDAESLGKIGTPQALALRGQIAIANAKLVYRRFREIFYGEPLDHLPIPHN